MRSLFIAFLAALVAGCSTRSVLVGDSTKSVREVSVEEGRAIEVVRKAVTVREGTNGRSWADRATYEVRSQTNGWPVVVLKTKRDLWGRPRGYSTGGDRRITIDEHGTVIDYFVGY